MTSAQKSEPRRNTRQRAAIREALRDAGGFRGAQDLHDELERRGAGVGLTTVYRNLQVMTQTGEVDALVTPAGEMIYRLCGRKKHHHLLVCRACGISVEIENTELEAWARTTARRYGFRGVSHTAELYGVCRGCSTDDRGSS